jgi:hypothetical protein
VVEALIDDAVDAGPIHLLRLERPDGRAGGEESDE